VDLKGDQGPQGPEGPTNNLETVPNPATARQNLGLVQVSWTGDYNDLSNRPSIPASGADFVAKSGGTFSGAVTFGSGADFTSSATFQSGVELQSGYTEQTYAVAGTSPSLSNSNGTVQTHSLTGTTAYSDGLSNGQSITLMIENSGGHAATWPSVTWVNNGGSAPDLVSTGDYTVVALWKTGGVLYGALVGDGR
jgi:FlaG/FlaF family flagellin (archaellin)